MYGVNQAECCDGETAEAASLRTSEIAAVPALAVQARTGGSTTTPSRSGQPRRRS
jgi:hypothetical protein